jgi:hypothetical protein
MYVRIYVYMNIYIYINLGQQVLRMFACFTSKLFTYNFDAECSTLTL